MDARQRLDALTGLRFLAALAVALSHSPLAHDPASPAAVQRLCGEGFLGVPFFFVLSGFVLAYSYHARLARPARSNLLAYYVARVARVWPLHLLALAAVLALPTGTPTGPARLLANAALVHAWVPNFRYITSYNSVTWSLSVEAFFYVVFPLIPWFAARRPTAGPGRFVAFAVLVWLVPAAFVAAFAGGASVKMAYLCGVFPPTRCGEFAAGAFLGLAFVKSRQGGNGSRSAANVALWTALELMPLLAVAVGVYFAARVPLLFRMGPYYAPAFAVLVAVAARRRGLLSRLLAGRVAVFLGEISFAFFLLHGVTFTHLAPRLESLIPDVYARTAALFAVAAVLAAAAHKLVELPLRSRIVGLGRMADPFRLGWLAGRLRSRAGNVR